MMTSLQVGSLQIGVTVSCPVTHLDSWEAVFSVDSFHSIQHSTGASPLFYILSIIVKGKSIDWCSS